MKNPLLPSILVLAALGMACNRDAPSAEPLATIPAPTRANQPRNDVVTLDSSPTPTQPPGASSSGAVTPASASSSATPTALSTVSANLVLVMENNRQTITVKPGQMLELIPPFEYPSWRIEFDDQILALVGPRGKAASVGSSGWLFQGKGLGRSELRLRTESTGCPKELPCPRVVDVDFVVMILVSP